MKKLKTNAEKIRTMSDSRLAKFIAEECIDISEKVCKHCSEDPGTCKGKVSTCRKAAANWLNDTKWSVDDE